MEPSAVTTRAVEILHDRGPGRSPRWRAGSGYLVGGRWVLTAAHNVDYLQTVPEGMLLVRRPGPTRAEFAARVVAAGSASGDAALLEIVDTAFADELAPVQWARIDRDRPEPVAGCWAVGYPAFKQREQAGAPSGWLVDTEQVAGNIQPGSNLQSRLLNLRVTSAPRPLPAGALDQSEWAGMSGAVVFAPDPFRGQVAVGIVIEHHRPEGVSSLTLLPATGLADLVVGQPGRCGVASDQLRLGDPSCWVELPRPEQAHHPYYRQTIIALAARTPVLLSRSQELAGLIAFATTGQDGYRWLTGGPWAGKTALAAHLFTACSQQADCVAYFLDRRAADADSDRFTSVVNAQLAWLLEEQPPPAPESRDAFPSLWQRASARAQRLSRPLLLVVDGLDEDMGPASPVRKASVASLLPVDAGGSTHVLVTSRPLAQLPPDVGTAHPLRHVRPAELRPSVAARAIQEQAETELRQVLDDAERSDTVAYDCVGLLAAAGGPLTGEDLAALVAQDGNMRHARMRVRSALANALARITETSGDGPFHTYRFAHQALADRAERTFAGQHELGEYRELIYRWADGYATRGWPADTPDYLLGAYATVLALQACDRLGPLLADFAYLDAAVSRDQIDQVSAAARAATSLFPADRTVAAVSRCLGQQAQNLRAHDPVVSEPGYPSRQLCLQARRLADPVAEAAAAYLGRLPVPQLVPSWTTSRISAALVKRTAVAVPVVAITISADGRYAITRGQSQFGPEQPDLLLWELGDDLGPPQSFTLPTSAVSAIAFSPDGRHLLTAGSELLWWDLAALDLGNDPAQPLPGVCGPVTAMTFSPDGRHALTCSIRDTGLFSPGSAELLWWELDGPGPVAMPLPGMSLPAQAAAISPDGQHALTAGSSWGTHPAELLWWDLAGPAPRARRLDGPTGKVATVAIGPDGRHALTGGDGSGFPPPGELLWWDLQADVPVSRALPEVTVPVIAAAFSPDGRHALTCGNSVPAELLYWDLGHEPPAARPLPGADVLHAIAFSPDGRHVMTGGGFAAGEVAWWDVADGTLLDQPPPILAAGVAEIAISPDGRHAITVGGDLANPSARKARWWDLDGDIPKVRPLPGTGQVQAAAFSPDGRHALTGGGTSGQGELLWWDISGPAPVSRPLPGSFAPVGAVAWSPDGRHALTAGGPPPGGALWWDLAGEVPHARPVPGPAVPLRVVGFSPDGRHAITGGGGQPPGEVLWWDFGDEVPTVQPLPGATRGLAAVAFSPDGTVAITTSGLSGGQGEVLWWHLGGPRPASTPVPGLNRPVTGVAFSPDGRHVLLSARGATGPGELLWCDIEGDTPDFSSTQTYRFDNFVYQVAIAPDPQGGFIALSSDDAGVVCWRWHGLPAPAGPAPG